jgi:hypothetical protein
LERDRHNRIDIWNGTGITGQCRTERAERDIQNGTGRTGQTEQDGQNRTSRTGQEKQTRKGRTEQAERVRQDRTGRKDRQNKTASTVRLGNDCQDRNRTERRGKPEEYCQKRTARKDS